MAVIPMKTSELDESSVVALLENDQLVHARQKLLGRRKLARETLMLMWGLRIYAVFMLGIVGYQIAHAL